MRQLHLTRCASPEGTLPAVDGCLLSANEYGYQRKE
jgi:hypothetical protein